MSVFIYSNTSATYIWELSYIYYALYILYSFFVSKPLKHLWRSWAFYSASLEAVLRITMLLVCCVTAWCTGAKRLGELVSIVGGICCGPLAFLMPPLIHLYVKKDQPLYSKVLNVIIFLSGLGITAYSIYTTSTMS